MSTDTDPRVADLPPLPRHGVFAPPRPHYEPMPLYTASQMREYALAAIAKVPCIASDPRCPCNDGDTCNYVATKMTPAFEVPHPDAAQLISIADLMPTLSGADPAMLANVGHYLRGLSDRVKALPVARTGPLRVAAEAVSAPVEAVPLTQTEHEVMGRALRRSVNVVQPSVSSLQKRALDHGFVYGRAPDDHWVEATPEQAAALLQDLLCIRVDIAPAASEDSVGAMAYRGNTVSYMYDRAKAYGEEIMCCWHVLKDAGKHPGRTNDKLHEVLQSALATNPPQAEPAGGGGAFKIALAVAKLAPSSGRVVINASALLSLDEELSEKFDEIARLTAELAQANAMCESLAASVQDLANAKAAADEAHAIEVQKDAGRIDPLQNSGSTVELVPMAGGGLGFRIGGLYRAVSHDIRKAIDAAMTKEKPHGRPE